MLGDLHGHYPALLHLLNTVQFDPTVDRLFSVGELIDRGPDSLACLQLLQQPWFYAVLGNHEAICLEAVHIFLAQSSYEPHSNEHRLLEHYAQLYEGGWLFDLDNSQNCSNASDYFGRRCATTMPYRTSGIRTAK